MTEQGVYGERLRSVFRLEEAPSFVLRRLDKTEIAVTRLLCNTANHGLSEPIPVDEAFLFVVQMRDCPSHDLWINDIPQKTANLKAGTTSIYDLRTRPYANGVSPYENMHFYVPRTTFNSILESEGLGRIDEVGSDPGIGTEDAVLAGLAQALAPAFDQPSRFSTLYVDHVTTAFAAHIAHSFAPSARNALRRRSALRDHEVNRVKDFLDTRLDGDVTESEMASTCGIGAPNVGRSFLQATGTLPHRWLIGRRIDKALGLINGTKLSIDEIAKLVGFQNQEHMTMDFLRLLDAKPDAFRQ